MIPLVLKIKNFLSYSSDLQTIDFRPYPIICLSGKNGHGKSALLDAITWTVWGQARKAISTTKPDQGVVRIGQTRVHTSLDFDVKGQIFRVSRDFFNSSLKSGANLEFQAFDPSTMTYKSLTDKTIKDTQEKITKTIGLDFETFINTSFFKQGASNEFSKKTPKERKQIICSILGLEKYDQVAARALTISKEHSIRVQQVQSLNERLNKEVLLFDQTIAELNIAKKVLLEKQQGVMNKNQKLATLQKRLSELEEKKKLIAELQTQVREWQLKRTELRALDRLSMNKLDLALLKKQRSELLDRQNELSLAQIAAQEKMHKLFQLKDSLAHAKELFSKNFDTQKEQLRNAIEQLKIQAHEQIALHDNVSLMAQNIEQQIGEVDKEVSKLETQECAFTRQSSCTEAVCPTCQQLITQEFKQSLLDKEQENLKSLKSAFLAIKAQKTEELATLEKTLEDVTNKTILLKQSHQEMLNSYKQKFDPKLFESHWLAQQETIVLTEEIANLETQITPLKGALEQSNSNAALLSKLNSQVEQALNLEKQATQRHTLCRDLLHTLAQIMSKQKQTQGHGEDLLKTSESLNQEILWTHNTIEKDRIEVGTLNQTIGKLEHQKLKLEGFSKEIEENSKQIATLEQEALSYQILSNAYGKNGIQALIVESVIPEIEFEANKILSKLSQDNSRIYIEPLKDLKKGGFKESLDIKIFDSAGVRSYEMFSGGEAFRIDFALRIGISKLLAKRAGAQLQTLIIDEGFGSQDPEGLARLIEGIHMIKDDFKKIIIVSHLKEFKEEFPVHFIVEKTSAGSTVSVEVRI